MIVGGRSKTLKTSIVCDLVVVLAAAPRSLVDSMPGKLP